MGRKQGKYTPHLAFGAFMLALALLWKFTMYIIGAPPSPQSEKLRSASKMISYLVERERGAHFRLTQAENTVRLVTHAVIRPDVAPPVLPTDDPIAYGVRLVARRGGRQLWTHDIWSTSRQTKQPLNAKLMGEAAFVADGSRQLTDGRYTTLTLPPMPIDAELWIYSVDDTPVLVRLLERQPRTSAQVKRSAQLMDDAIGSELTQGRFLGTWSMLDPDEREELLQYRWSKLSALGERDLDYVAVPHYVMELEAMAQAKPDAWWITDRSWVAVNAYGPCTLTLEAEGTLAAAAASLAQAGASASSASSDASLGGDALMVRVVGESGVGGWQAYQGPLAVPAAFHSVWVRAANPLRPLRLRASGCEDPVRGGVVVRKGKAVRLDGSSATFAMGSAEVDRTLRLDVRRIMPPADDEAPQPWSVNVVFRGARDEVLGQDELPLVAIPQFFDQALPATPDGHAVPLALSEATSLRVVAPVGTSELEVTASVPALVRAFRYTGQASALVSTFELASPLVAWRGAPLQTRAWQAVAPSDQAADAAYVIHAAQRLQPVGMTNPFSDEPGQGEAAAAAVALYTLPPEEAAMNHLLLEAVTAQSGAAAAPQDETELPMGRQVIARLPVDEARPVVLRCLAATVPATITLRIGDVTHTKTQLVARDAWEFATEATGEVPVALAATPATRCFLNRQVAGGGLGAYRRRTLYKWDPGERLSTTVAHAGATSVYAVIYAEAAVAGRGAVPVAAELRGGLRQRLVGRLVTKLTVLAKTVDALVFEPRGDALWLDRSGPLPGFSAVMRFGLGADIRRGPQTVIWEHRGARPLWVRFVANVPGQQVGAPSLRRIELMDPNGESGEAP